MYTATYNRPKHMACQPTQQNRMSHQATKKMNSPLANIFSKKDGWDITLSLPGFAKEEIEISIDNRILKITGKRTVDQNNYSRNEWSNGEITRSFTLPENVDIEGIQAEMKNGILTLVVPKKEVKVSNISVQ